MKSHWKLFHKKAEDLHPEEVVFLRGVKQYMTRQNAVDLITSKFSKFAEVYQTYQDITKALNERNSELLESTILDYQKTNTEMDTAIQTLRQNRKYVLNSAKFEYSNGPLEGINRKIKTLKRTCYGFANQKFFFLRIDCIFSQPYQLTDILKNRSPDFKLFMKLVSNRLIDCPNFVRFNVIRASPISFFTACCPRR